MDREEFGETGAENAPRLLRSNVAFAGGFVRVRLDEIRLPSGRHVNREVVEHPGAVGLLALTDDDEVLLVNQWRHAAGRSLLEIPAGTREPAESAEETARRELVEEVGYAPGELHEIATFYLSPGYSNEVITIFRASGCQPVGHEPDPDEGVSLVKVRRGEIPMLLADPGQPILDGKTLIALLSLLAETHS